MKAVEFLTRVDVNNSLDVPPDVAAQLPRGQEVRVIVLVPEPEEDQEWSRLAADRFLAGYDDSDAIYDRLPSG
jgi:hypothetical protein